MDINIPEVPTCRYRKHSMPESASAEAWRDDVLIPALEKGDVTVHLTPRYGMPVSWCEEAFGGLVRALGADVMDRITLIGEDSEVNEACIFMQDQVDRGGKENDGSV